MFPVEVVAIKLKEITTPGTNALYYPYLGHLIFLATKSDGDILAEAGVVPGKKF